MPEPTANPQFLPPNLAEFMSRRMRDVAANINCVLIGTITAINENGTITASVVFQKVIKGVLPLPNNQGIADQIINYPALVNVPVFIYQGGGAAILMPIKVGDTCLLLFCDRDMDIWFETAQVAPPNSDRVHNINDAIALVGINNIMSLFPPNTSGVIQIFDETGERLSQSGFLQPYAGATAPNGWLLCYGQAVSRTAYPILFSVIGTTYGAGDGSTTFNLPDLRGRTVFGLDNMGGTDAMNLYGSGGTQDQFTLERTTLGGIIGECMHTQIVPELVEHIHTVVAQYNPGSGAAGSGNSGGNTTLTTNPTGGGLPFNVVPNAIMVNWLIKI